ncbi:MAG: hypothetical protein WBO70_07940 [Erysipelotrichaceae bacterium]
MFEILITLMLTVFFVLTTYQLDVQLINLAKTKMMYSFNIASAIAGILLIIIYFVFKLNPNNWEKYVLIIGISITIGHLLPLAFINKMKK